MNLDKDIEKSIKHIEERIKYSDVRPEIVCNKEDIENILLELKTYKKIAEKLAQLLLKIGEDLDENICQYNSCAEYIEGNCDKCIIDWAKREVENGKSN